MTKNIRVEERFPHTFFTRLDDHGLGFVIISVVSCLHFGSPFHYSYLWDKIKESIKNTSNHYAIFIGDIGDYGVPDKRGVHWGNTHTPQEQVELIMDELYDIKDKIISLVYGNHEERLHRPVSIYPNRFISRALKIHNGELGGYYILDVGSHGERYVCYFEHGQKVGGQSLLRAKKMLLYTMGSAEIIGLGHLHNFAEHSFTKYNPETGKDSRIIFFQTSGYKKDATYERSAKYLKNHLGSSLLRLNSKKHEVLLDQRGEYCYD